MLIVPAEVGRKAKSSSKRRNAVNSEKNKRKYACRTNDDQSIRARRGRMDEKNKMIDLKKVHCHKIIFSGIFDYRTC